MKPGVIGAIVPISGAGPNGGTCTTKVELSNCRSNGDGGCTCDSTVVSHQGDC